MCWAQETKENDDKGQERRDAAEREKRQVN